MKKFIIFLSLAALTLIVSNCGKTLESRLLLRADSLLTRNELDSAQQLLTALEMTPLNRNESEYLCLLKAIFRCKSNEENLPDTLFDASIRYFEQQKDKDLLAFALIYKGTLLLKDHKNIEAAKVLKNAEEIAKESKQDEIVIRSHVMLSLLNSLTGNNKLALKYAHKVQNFASAYKNKRWIGYSYDMLSTIYEDLNMSDSSTFYSNKAADYIQYQPKTDQPKFLNNQASEYFHQKQYDKAVQLLKQSLEIQPLLETYGKLAQVYTAQGKKDSIATLWQDVLRIPDQTLKAQFLYTYSKWLQQQGRFEEACQAERERAAIKDTLLAAFQAEEVKTIQADIDQQRNVIRWQQWAIRALVLLIMLLILFSMREYSNRKEILRQANELDDQQQLLATYEGQLEEQRQELEQHKNVLNQNEAENKAREKKIRELERKIAALRDEQNRMLTVGKTLYEDIVAGGKARTWKKRDYESFMEYYRTLNPEYVNSLNRQHEKLTPQRKFRLALLKLNFNETDIQNIMNLSDSAYRKLKSRTKD